MNTSSHISVGWRTFAVQTVLHFISLLEVLKYVLYIYTYSNEYINKSVHAAISFSNSIFHKPIPQNSDMLKLVAELNSTSAVQEYNIKGSLCN